MATYVVWPPPPEERMAFMDALAEAGIPAERDPESFILFVKPEQETAWREIRERFRLEVDQEDPPYILEG